MSKAESASYKKIYIKLPGQYIEIVSNCLFTIGEREELLLQAYVPGSSFTNDEQTQSVATIRNRASANEKSLIVDGEIILIQDDWSKLLPLYLFHLIYSVAHKKWLTKNLFAVHSACVGSVGNYDLIVGHSGSGKTTVALNLLRNSDLKLFSGNKTLVTLAGGKLRGVAGTATVTCKDNDYNRHKDLLLHNTNFVNRSAARLKNEFYSYENDVLIRKIYLIRLNDGVEETIEMAEGEAVIFLYPYFLDYVNSDILFPFSNGIFDGTDTFSCLKSSLLKSLGESIASIKVYSVSGSLDYISKTILEGHDSE